MRLPSHVTGRILTVGVGLTLAAALTAVSGVAATYAAGSDPTLCHSTTNRLDLPASYPVNVCWDGSKVVIKNTTMFVLSISARGSLGTPSRSAINGDAAGVTIAGLDGSAYTLPPGYEVTVPVGTGGASFRWTGNAYNEKYVKLKSLESFLPSRIFQDYEAISTFSDELSSDSSEYAQCRQHANFIKLAACSAQADWNVNFAIDRFGVTVGVQLLKGSVGALLNLLTTAVWATNARSAITDLKNSPGTFSIAAATSPGGGGAPNGGGTAANEGSGSSGSVSGGSSGSGGTPRVLLAQGAAAPEGYRYAVSLSGFAPRSAVSVECYDSVDPGGFFHFAIATNADGGAYTQSECYSGDGPQHWVTAGSVTSNYVSWSSGAAPLPPPPPPPPPPSTWSETVGGPTHTWTNYSNAGGSEGATIATSTTVQIACRLEGFAVADGNVWWYRIAASPWNNQYYASADAFYNNGQTTGSLHGTPFYDPHVPHC